MCRLAELQRRRLQEKRVEHLLSLHPLHATASPEKVRPLHETLVRDFLRGSAAEVSYLDKFAPRSAFDDQRTCRRWDAFTVVASNSALCIHAHIKIAEISLKFAKVSLAFDARTKKPVLVVADSFCRGNSTLMYKDEVAHSDVWVFLVNGDMNAAHEVLSWFAAEGAFSTDLYDHYNFNLSELAGAIKKTCRIRKDLFSSCVLIQDHLGLEHNDFGATTPCVMCSVQIDHPQTMCDHSCRGGRAVTFLSGQSNSVEALIRHEVSLILDIGDHPNLAKFYGAFDVSYSNSCSAIGGEVCWALLMESCQYNLLDVIQITPYHEYQCVELARSLLGALQRVHSAGIVHRRVQPTSVQIWPCGRFVLTGFHQAVRVSEGEELARVCCKESYRAPELVEGRHADCDSKMDIFAFGLVLYFAVSGVEPLSLDVNPQELAIKLTRRLNDVSRQKTLKNNFLLPPTRSPNQSRSPSESRTPSEATTPRNGSNKFKLDFSCRRTKQLSRLFKDFLLMTTRWNPKRRPTAEDALTCEWLSSAEAGAVNADFRNLPSLSLRAQRTSSAKSTNRPQTPTSPSGSAMKAVLVIRKDMDGEPALPPRAIGFDDSLMPVAPCGHPTSRFQGRRSGVLFT